MGKINDAPPKKQEGKREARKEKKEKKGEKKQGGKKKGKEAQSFGGMTDAVAEELGLLGGYSLNL